MIDIEKSPKLKKKSAGKAKKPVKRRAQLKRPVGAQSIYTKEIGDLLCDKLIQIGSLRKVCELEGMPDKATVFRWLLKSEGEDADPAMVIFRDQYVRARKLSKEYKFDEHWEDIEKTALVPMIVNDLPLMVDGKIVTCVTPQSVQLARLKHDAFKWQASKEDPKKYGDNINLNHSGNIGMESLIAGAGSEPEASSNR